MNIRDLSISEIKEKLNEMLNTLENEGLKESYVVTEIEDSLNVISKMEDFLSAATNTGVLGESFAECEHYNFKADYQCVFDTIVVEYNDLLKKKN